MKKIKINLLDFKDKDRDDFLGDLRADWIKLFGKTKEYKQAFIGIFTEIVKNIYDHADCNGVLMFSFKEKEFLFTISSKSKYFNYQESKISGSSKKGSKVNFGIGLQMIQELSDFLDLKLNVIQNKERLTYVGRWEIQKLP